MVRTESSVSDIPAMFLESMASIAETEKEQQ